MIILYLLALNIILQLAVSVLSINSSVFESTNLQVSLLSSATDSVEQYEVDEPIHLLSGMGKPPCHIDSRYRVGLSQERSIIFCGLFREIRSTVPSDLVCFT